jgi:hypothetical protein
MATITSPSHSAGKKRALAPPLGVRVVCISDTHAQHRGLVVPDGDILIHGGDYTSFGSLEHARDFNDWLGTLPHRHKVGRAYTIY